MNERSRKVLEQSLLSDGILWINIILYLFTKSKPKFKLLHDLCSRSTFFLGLCETFLFDGINYCKIQIPDFTVIRCDRFSRDGVCIYLRNRISFKTCLKFSNSVWIQ